MNTDASAVQVFCTQCLQTIKRTWMQKRERCPHQQHSSCGRLSRWVPRLRFPPPVRAFPAHQRGPPTGATRTNKGCAKSKMQARDCPSSPALLISLAMAPRQATRWPSARDARMHTFKVEPHQRSLQCDGEATRGSKREVARVHETVMQRHVKCPDARRVMARVCLCRSRHAECVR